MFHEMFYKDAAYHLGNHDYVNTRL